MSKKSGNFKLLSVLITAVVVSIITCCTVFFNIEKENNSYESDVNPMIKVDDFIFDYGDKLVIPLGDVKSLSPKYVAQNNYLISYSTSSEIFEISSDGILLAYQIGSAMVEIKSHDITIKSVEVSVVAPRYEIKTYGNCEASGNKIKCYDKSFCFELNLLNSLSKEFFTSELPIIESKGKLNIFEKNGIIYVNGEGLGVITIRYPTFNFTLDLVVEFV